MKKPDGTVDLIGLGMQVGLGVIDLVKEFAPDEETRRNNKIARKTRVAIRRLNHGYKGTPVDVYVKVNFPECDEVEKNDLVQYITSRLKTSK